MSVCIFCGTEHSGVVCSTGKVVCCLCFEAFDIEKLNVLPNGDKENVCKKCAEREKKIWLEKMTSRY